MFSYVSYLVLVFSYISHLVLVFFRVKNRFKSKRLELARMLSTDSQQTLTLIAMLPDHLIIDNILPRLPAKSLIRFKTVCKIWLSVISSIDFEKSHLKFSSLNPNFVVLNRDRDCDYNYTNKLYLIPSNDDGNNNGNVNELVTFDLDPNWIFDAIILVGGCNGLLCFSFQYSIATGYFCVWNPVTRKCRDIMYPDGEEYTVCYGFSYASSIDDYKIVAKFCRLDYYHDYYHEIFQSYYYSLRSSEWKMIIGVDFTTTTRTRCSNTLFYPSKDLNCWQQDKCIVGFDLVHEKLEEIPYMDWLSRYDSVDMFDMNECVSLLCCGYDGDDIWVLKEFGDWNSWEKMFSFKFGGMEFCNLTETGRCFFRSCDGYGSGDSTWDSAQLNVLDPREDNPNDSHVGIDVSGQINGTGAFVESLISPFIF